MPRLYQFLLSAFALLSIAATGQTNMQVTNPEAEQILFSDYEPASYLPADLVNHPEQIAAGLLDAISPDSLRRYLEEMAVFGNRNTGADTSSADFGMGAARRWAYQRLQGFSEQNENRLVVSYFQFDQDICGMGRHRNVIAVLPGVGSRRDEFVLVEGHLDSRCEDVCDSDCIAHGMDDNGSGSALVLELARTMSAYAFDRTLIFMLTTGEEQGLFGANAVALYFDQHDLDLKAVFNNDIVGGIICGQTASPPGCPGLNHIDSINVRLYSHGNINSRNKALARFTKLEYLDNLSDIAPVFTEINLMTGEDRAGRGGDHIPFRQRGFPAIRTTSANEHGNGNPATPDYHDRQHTVEDLLGVDTDGDGQLDSFFVDFNYLARNTLINGNAAAMAALGPNAPLSFGIEDVGGGFAYAIDDPDAYGQYRLGIRQITNNYFDTLITVNSAADTLFGLEPGLTYFISACTVDSNGVESLFSNERFESLSTSTETERFREQPFELLQNRPNPFDEATTIAVRVDGPVTYRQAAIVVRDMGGRTLAEFPIDLSPGIHEVTYGYENHQYQPGTYVYSLVIDGKAAQTRQMVYAW